MVRGPPEKTRTDTTGPDTPLVRSWHAEVAEVGACDGMVVVVTDVERPQHRIARQCEAAVGCGHDFAAGDGVEPVAQVVHLATENRRGGADQFGVERER